MSRLQRGLSGITGGLGGNPGQGKSFDELKQLIHGKLVDKLDLSKVSELAGDTLRKEIRVVVERLCDTKTPC